MSGLNAWSISTSKQSSVPKVIASGRLIDIQTGTRKYPMKVLVLGMSRTGTMSMYTALKKLGYHPYHMAEAVQSPKLNFALWREALNASFHNKGKPWGRAEFDKILGNYDAVADVPCAILVDELVSSYPDAKVILTNRDVDKWLLSMDNSAGKVMRWWTWPYISSWDKSLAGPWYNFACVVCPAAFGTMTDFSRSGPARAKYLDHYDYVRRIVPKERLLEFHASEGWKPLCEFLDHKIPDDSAYPNVNDGKNFIFFHALMWYMAFGKMVLKVGAVLAPVLGVYVWRYVRT